MKNRVIAKGKKLRALHHLKKVISGGQTGADQAALRAAASCGLETGGWAPRNFITTAGPNAELKTHFNLREISCSDSLSLAMYVERSKRNVDESGVTLIFRTSHNSPGTNSTIVYCRSGKWGSYYLGEPSSPPHRPHLIIDGILEEVNEEEIVTSIRAFLEKHSVKQLNVAGSRSRDSRDKEGQKIEAILLRVFQ